MKLPTVTLTNGLVVANFSSPHEFKFVDGSILPACSPERANHLMLHAAMEMESITTIRGIDITDVSILFLMSKVVKEELERLLSPENKNFDILIVPLPVMTAMKNEGMDITVCRTVRVADRVNKLCHIDRFCI